MGKAFIGIRGDKMQTETVLRGYQKLSSPAMTLADVIQPPSFSLAVFLTLTLCLAVSLLMFVRLIRRWTVHRYRYDMEQWAAQRQFSILARPSEQNLPPPLDGPEGAGLSARWYLKDDIRSILRLEMFATELRVFHVCIVPSMIQTAPVALRPIKQEQSILSRFRLPPAASAGSERFIIHGSDLSSNLRISESMLGGILPPDIAVIYVGGHFMLDFSARPFDPIEFDRMLALAEQISRVTW